ncbi:MAG: hypothetical protein HC836_39410 [Richelia sp. RM2_1_2]|nr:hypothetical protein [Richelia sp. RM2_1_2]
MIKFALGDIIEELMCVRRPHAHLFVGENRYHYEHSTYLFKRIGNDFDVYDLEGELIHYEFNTGFDDHELFSEFSRVPLYDSKMQFLPDIREKDKKILNYEKI